MDTPNLPENEIEEITWQDDENRATLFLRSVFVLLSGALILNAERYISFGSSWLEVVYLLGMNVLLPVCIIWFFFGQGLRPVEWLSDQKYNAWNYGINFKDWKTHLKWAVILCVWELAFFFIVIPLFMYGVLPFPQLSSLVQSSQEWFFLILKGWLIAVSYIWLIWGYLLFGCIQGFSKIVTFILIAAGLSIGVILILLFSPAMTMLIPFFLFPFFGFVSCWKTKSLAPMLYSSILFLIIILMIIWVWFIH